ncbi:hypothetical protein [uncultured Microbulbifer sp.]|uniref:hypothetical protein n=1 Tax=uncultured Microbulbifer sp. TaxID=348147 RepID=UPI00262A2E7A|nr:hypothetical protein [uncultured Microbulbifer sp.]
MKLRCVLILVCLQTSPASLFADALTTSGRQVISTNLKEVRLVAELHGFAIIAGRHCIDCDENLAIYIRRIARPGESTGSAPQRGDSDRYTYPGKYVDYMTKKLVEKTRMFYGYCYEGQPSLLWLTEYRSGDKWVKSEYLVLLGDGGLKHRFVEGQQPSLAHLQRAQCEELPGIFAEMEP